VSQSTADENVRELEAARSRLAVAEARSADRIIRAPFSGILGLRSVSPGTLVSPGTQITTLDDISIIKLDFQVPERFISLLASGQQIITEAAAYPDHQFIGVARTIASRVDPITRAATVRAEIANPERLLRPGMLLTVNLIADQRQQLAVRETAVVPIGEKKFVFVVGADNKVERALITTGAREGGYVEVLGGLTAGQAVVYSGTLQLRQGIKVQVLSDDTPDDTPPGKRISGQTSSRAGDQGTKSGAESGD
jgi:membrane fusion protein (multidrug efflux system)